MYIPKVYDPHISLTEYEGFKNPALCRENGVLTSYCCLCRGYIGNEYDTDYNSLIRREYCKSCADNVRMEQNRERQRKHRRGKKQMKKEYEQENGLLRQRNALDRQENGLLRRKILALEDDLNQLANQNGMLLLQRVVEQIMNDPEKVEQIKKKD